MKLVRLFTDSSLVDLTMSLSFVTGNPMSPVVTHTSMSQVSHTPVSQWSAPPSSLSLSVKKGNQCDRSQSISVVTSQSRVRWLTDQYRLM